MQEETIIALGQYCEDLLSQEFFNVLVQQYEFRCFEHFTHTEAKNLKEREGIYNQMRALQDFTDHLKAVIVQKDQIEKKQQLSDLDAEHIEGID